MFKVIIYGGTDNSEYDFFEEKCISLLRNKAKEGCGIMVYSTGEEYNDKFTSKFGIDIRYFPTEWKKYGKDALKERNNKMTSDADALIIFVDKNLCTDEKKVPLVSNAIEKGVNIRIVRTEKGTK